MNSLSVSKLAKFFDQEIAIAKKLLIVSNNGVYELFGRFRIEPIDSYFIVIDTSTKERVEFSTLKYAVVWCVLIEGRKFTESRRLEKLDLKLSSLHIDIQANRKILKTSTNAYTKIIHATKLQEDSYKRRNVIREIESFINSSKMLQDKKFSSGKEQKNRLL